MLPFGRHNKTLRRWIITGVLGLFVAVLGGNDLVKPVYAFPVEDAPHTALTAKLVAGQVKKEVKLKFGEVLWSSAAQALVSTVDLFFRQFAYDMAVGLASGAKGQNPFAFLSQPGAYFGQLAQDSVGEFVGTMSNGAWGNLGLCKPSLPNVALKIPLGLVDDFGLGGAGGRATPKCQWQQIRNNWSTMIKEAESPGQLLGHVALSFDPGQSDISIALKADETAQALSAQKIQEGMMKRIEGQGMQSKEGLISGKIQTPAQVYKRMMDELAANPNNENTAIRNTALFNATMGSDVWLGVGKTVLSTFTNTLATNLLKTALTGLFSLGGGGDNGSQVDLRNLYALNPSALSSVEGARASFGGLLVSNINTGTDIDVLTQFASCPSKREEASLYNCVIDSQFNNALQQSVTGDALTIRQAVAKGFLDRGKPFGFVGLGREPEYTDGYPYSSMKKLRLVGVIPVGWEMAALRVRDQGAATLGDVLDGFSKQGTVPGCNNDDQESPFCGLVDQDWVLKAPKVQCAASGWSALADGNGGRQEACVDLKQCVQDDGHGNCKAWGYCTAQKNSWTISGDQCPAQFASCQTYRNASGTEASYLENTLDFGSCNADNAGCRGYSTKKIATASTETWDANERIYLNGKAGICTAAAAGCTEFLSNASGTNQGTSTYVRKPPAWLGCTGEENDPSECANYARVCRAEEAGCERYTPTNGDPALPGVTTALDICPQECVGYAAYRQEASMFEPALFPQYMIPSRATTCPSADVGCSEFTNLENEHVEYYREMRACQRPADDSTTYLTWEGSETSGYQIRNWELKKSGLTITANQGGSCIKPSGSNRGVCANTTAVCSSDADCQTATLAPGKTGSPPCTNYQITENGGQISLACTDTDSNQATCVKADLGINPDCRAFYDKDADIFYRLYSRTIVSSSSCTFYRTTGTGYVVDQNLCQAMGGTWSSTTLKCALAGVLSDKYDEITCSVGRGTWRGDRQECVYAGLPLESRSCAPTSNGCREFSGNAGDNVRTILPPSGGYEQFESAIADWQKSTGSTITISSEAVIPGAHAAKIKGTVWRALALQQDKTYIVEFWAKGVGNVNIVLMKNAATNAPSVQLSQPQALSSEWQKFSFGPKTFTVPQTGGDMDPQLSIITTGANAVAYVDAFRVRRVEEYLTLLKDSIRDIPLSCDSAPQVAGGGYSPQYMLGCQAYTDRAAATHYLKSFSRFCRDNSIGCQDLVDTHNSAQTLCSGQPGECRMDTNGDGVVNNSDRVMCTIPTGQTSCVIPKLWNTENSGVCRGEPGPCKIDTNDDGVIDNTDSVVCTISADQSGQAHHTSCNYGPTITGTVANIATDDLTAPLRDHKYLVVGDAGSCKAEDRGCMGLGIKSQEGTWSTVYLKNDPDTYDQSLCKLEENGCDAWSGSGGATYFKNPMGKECEWRDSFTIGGLDYRGWVKKGKAIIPNVTEAQCTALLVGGEWADGKCVKADLPCYAGLLVDSSNKLTVNLNTSRTYLTGGQTFGVWKNIDSQYTGLTGMCPKEQSGCMELLDPNDCRGGYPRCTAYYVKDNDKLDKKTCQEGNLASLKEGCVLFDNTAQVTKTYKVADSYSARKPIAAVSTGASNDANLLLKVKRDRSCAEWLMCKSSVSVFDSATGRFKSVCNTIGRCSQMATGAEGSDTTRCSNWIDDIKVCASDAWGVERQCNIASDCGGGACVLKDKRLTREAYQSRKFDDFTSPEYTGYSIPDMYPLEQLEQADIGSAGIHDWRLVKTCSGTSNQNCVNGLMNPDGTRLTPDSALTQQCRIYPDTGAPFPNTPKVAASALYKDASICKNADGNGIKCECDYQKVNYGGQDFYFPRAEKLPAKVCISGPADLSNAEGTIPGAKKQGDPCADNAECASGQCEVMNKVAQYEGYRGYCLEKDKSRAINGDESQNPCFAWLPVESLIGAPDIYNQYVEAGFQPKPGNEMYCADPTNGAPTIVVDYNNAGTWFGKPQITGSACNNSGPNSGGNYECGEGSTKCGYALDNAPDGTGWCSWPDASVPIIKDSARWNQTSKKKGAWGGLYVPATVVSSQNGATVVIDEHVANLNFLGCYQVADGGSLEGHAIESDWKGPGPIYKWMIKSIQIDFGDACAANGQCYFWSREACDNRWLTQNTPLRCLAKDVPSSPEYANRSCSDADNFVMQLFVDGRQIVVQPIFDDTGKLVKFKFMTVVPDSDVGMLILLQNVTITLKPGCDKMVEVGTQALTDRFWKRPPVDYKLTGTTGTGSNPNITKDSKYAPWGAVGPNSSAPYVIGIEKPGDKCLGWCGALHALEQLKQLFAKTINVFRWKGPGTTAGAVLNYEQVVGQSNFVYDSTGSGQGSGYTPSAPHIASIAACDAATGQCKEGGVGITVGDKSDATSVLSGVGVLSTTMKFFAWAGENQMPLKRIIVDWHGRGDGPGNVGKPEYDAGDQNFYRNRRGLDASGNPICVTETLPAPNFGQIIGKTCDTAYYKFELTYTCPGSVSPFWHGETGSDACPSADFKARFHGCCVYHPRAKVIDNWGWCSGTDNNPDHSYNCGGVEDPKGWVQFPGQVLVAPKG